jgi:hypothetical protein
MADQLKTFMDRWGGLFTRELKARLLATYDYAPAFNGDAYSQGRNDQFKGSANKVASGGLYNSISWQATDDGFVLLMNRYWEWVNYGRQPGSYAPITPLEEWATLKGFDNPRSAAFGISKNLFKFGIQPTYFYDDALDNLEAQFNASLEDQFGKSFQDFIDNLVLGETNQTSLTL